MLTLPRPIASTPAIDELLAAGAAVAMGVSGGKDSCALALALNGYLDTVGHRSPRVLIHSDLGLTEWRESLPTCRRLADRLNLELIVVRRQRGGMMERWEQRWRDNVDRYVFLSCVKLILPWSTPDMRFCTSELKTDVICRELSRRFPGRAVVSASGIRRQESSARAKSPVAKAQPKLASVARRTSGVDWHPIIDWTLDDVLGYLAGRQFPLHEAYTRYGAGRVSCAFCIMSAADDLMAGARCEDNHALYRRMVGLEIRSTFAFQGGKWLGDVAPHLLADTDRVRLAEAKEAAAAREAAEVRIPGHLLYTKGWPTCVPSEAEADLLCAVRRDVGAIVGIAPQYLTPDALIDRYRELMAAKRRKGAA